MYVCVIRARSHRMIGSRRELWGWLRRWGVASSTRTHWQGPVSRAACSSFWSILQHHDVDSAQLGQASAGP